MTLKLDCLGVTPLTYAEIEQIQAQWQLIMHGGTKTIIKRLLLSHERLRAERDGLEIMNRELEERLTP